MPVVFDSELFPTCCGKILPARLSTTYCPYCYQVYNTDEIVKEHHRLLEERSAPKSDDTSNQDTISSEGVDT